MDKERRAVRREEVRSREEDERSKGKLERKEGWKSSQPRPLRFRCVSRAGGSARWVWALFRALRHGQSPSGLKKRGKTGWNQKPCLWRHGLA